MRPNTCNAIILNYLHRKPRNQINKDNIVHCRFVFFVTLVNQPTNVNIFLNLHAVWHLENLYNSYEELCITESGASYLPEGGETPFRQ